MNNNSQGVHEALVAGYIDIDDVIKRAREIEERYINDYVQIQVSYEDKRWGRKYRIRFAKMKMGGKLWVLSGSAENRSELDRFVTDTLGKKTQYPVDEAREVWVKLVQSYNWEVKELTKVDWEAVGL